MSNQQTIELTKKDFVSDQDVRWCPGCGDYAILSQVQKVFPQLGVPKEKFLVVSGIGCSSRFPYYMDSFGFHSIHGRAPALATGAKIANPDLSVWIVTGDGDSMSIGGNHFIHVLRRNFDLNILLFNNQVYGLTKGQYSPTSEIGRISNSTPFGSVDYPFNPPCLLWVPAELLLPEVLIGNKNICKTYFIKHINIREHLLWKFIRIVGYLMMVLLPL